MDLKLADKEETFTATVTYDTEALYGKKIEGICKFTLTSE